MSAHLAVVPEFVADKVCADCGCGLVQQRTWAEASTDQRRAWLAADFRLLQGRGLCRACYLRAWKEGAFPQRPPGENKAPAKPCARCGVANTDGLCRDCEDVLDRDEEALWRA